MTAALDIYDNGLKIARVLFRKYNGQVMMFKQLPDEAQKSIYQYMMVDGENYNYNRQKYGIVNIPADVLVAATWENFSACGETNDDTWETYQNFYYKRKPTTKHPTVWPIIIGPDVIQDGWHRFHQYVRQGLKVIPCILPNPPRQRALKESIQNDSGKAVVKNKSDNIALNTGNFSKENKHLESLYTIKDRYVQQAIWEFTKKADQQAFGVALKKLPQVQNLLKTLLKLGIALDKRCHVYSALGNMSPEKLVNNGMLKMSDFVEATLNIDAAVKVSNIRRDRTDSMQDHILHFALPVGYKGCFYISKYCSKPKELEMLLFPNQKYKLILKKTIKLEGGNTRTIWSFVPMTYVSSHGNTDVTLTEFTITPDMHNQNNCWILPDGTVLPVDRPNSKYHNDIAAEHFADQRPADLTRLGSQWAAEAAAQAGWIRVYIPTGNRAFSCNFYADRVGMRSLTVLMRIIKDEHLPLYMVEYGHHQVREFVDQRETMKFVNSFRAKIANQQAA